MRAYIKLWGNEYLVKEIRWNEDNNIENVSFKKGNQEDVVFHTEGLSDIHGSSIPGVDRNFYHTDLKNRVAWKEK